MITIRKPLSFSEIGRKDNQEDYLYPALADRDTRVFVLCDGMGGHDNGEVASKTAGSTLGEYLSSCSEIDLPTFETGLTKAYEALDSIDTNTAKRPGTTMTCLCLNSDNYLVAHIGDSRIYHIRPSLFNPDTRRGGILYQSSDHSLVNDLLKAGEITEEEARDFPQKNVITRAMQPHLPKRHKADAYIFDDVKGGDYFFLCCDGVLEQLSNERLCEILADKELDDEQKLAEIKAVCDGRTKDNYTCWLVPVDKAEIGSSPLASQVIQADVECGDEPIGKPATTQAGIAGTALAKRNPLFSLKADKKMLVMQLPLKKLLLWVAAIVAVLGVICGGYYLYRNFTGKSTEKAASTIVNSVKAITED